MFIQSKTYKNAANFDNNPNLIYESLIIGIVISLLLIVSMPLDVFVFDEGIVLSDAMRVMAGDVVHRDFFSSYGPAQYYIVAGLLKISTGSFFVERFYDAAVKAGVCGLLFYIARRLCRRSIAVSLAATGSLWFLSLGSFLYPIFPCMVLGLLATFLLVPQAAGRSPGSLPVVVAGGCAGLTALFRYDIGFFLLVANLLGAALLIGLSDPWRTAVRNVLRLAVMYAVGAAIVFLPAALAYLAVAPVASFWHDIVEYPLKYYAAMRSLPFPTSWGPAALGILLTPVALVLAVLEIVRLSSRGRRLDPLSGEGAVRAHLVLFGFCAGFFFLKGIVRVSPLHMSLGNVPALIVIGCLLGSWSSSRVPVRLASIALMLFALVPPLVLAGRDLRHSLADPGRSLAGWMGAQAGLWTGGVADSCRTAPGSGIARLDTDYARIANYLVTQTRSDERIVVALDRHDKIFANPLALYFAVDRLPGTHWHEFDPGLQTRADIQADIIADLERNHVRWVVRDGSFDDVNEPNGSARSSGVHLLDTYLAGHYRAVASAGKVEAWLLDAEQPAPLGSDAACKANVLL